jgi:hypothetical protein
VLTHRRSRSIRDRDPLDVRASLGPVRAQEFEEAGEVTVDAQIREFVEGEGGMGETDEGM